MRKRRSSLENALYKLISVSHGAYKVLDEVQERYTECRNLQNVTIGPVRKKVTQRNRIVNFTRYVQFIEEEVKRDSRLQFLLAGVLFETANLVTFGDGSRIVREISNYTALDMLKMTVAHIQQLNVSHASAYLSSFLNLFTAEKIPEYLQRRSLE